MADFSMIAHKKEKIKFLHGITSVFYRKTRKAFSDHPLFNSVREGIFVLNSHRKFSGMNKAAGVMIGYRENEILGENYRSIIHPQSLKDFEQVIDTRDSGNSPPAQIIFIHKEGYEVVMEMTVTFPEPGCTIIFLLDITEKKRLEKEKRALATRSQQEVLSVIAKTRNEERKQLAQNIHDGLGQLLTAARMNLSAAEADWLGGYNDGDATLHSMNKNLKTAIDIIDEAMRECKAVSSGLCAVDLKNEGLVPAVKGLCEKMNLSEKTRVRFYSNAVFLGMDEMLHQTIYRMCQELVNNAFKHARATEIILQIFNREGKVIIHIEDDGIGFNDNNTGHTGMGLNNIKDRIKNLSGNVLIDSEIGRGSTIILEIPI